MTWSLWNLAHILKRTKSFLYPHPVSASCLCTMSLHPVSAPCLCTLTMEKTETLLYLVADAHGTNLSHPKKIHRIPWERLWTAVGGSDWVSICSFEPQGYGPCHVNRNMNKLSLRKYKLIGFIIHFHPLAFQSPRFQQLRRKERVK